MMSLLRKITDRHYQKARPSSWRSLRRPKAVDSTSRDRPCSRLSQPRSHPSGEQLRTDRDRRDAADAQSNPDIVLPSHIGPV